MRQLTTPGSAIKKFAKHPGGMYRARLAEPYDGIGQFVLVALAGSSVSAAYKARVASGDFGGGRTFPQGTPVVVHSYRGSMEVFLGNQPSPCDTELCQRDEVGTWNNADGGFDWEAGGNITIPPAVGDGRCTMSGFVQDSAAPSMSIPNGRIKPGYPFQFLFLGSLAADNPIYFWANDSNLNSTMVINFVGNDFTLYGPFLAGQPSDMVLVSIDRTQDFYVRGVANEDQFSATIWQATESEPGPQVSVAVVSPADITHFSIVFEGDLAMKYLKNICTIPESA